MEQGKELLEVGNGGGLESIKKGSEYCSRCFVLEKRCDEVKEWCTGLESEIEKKMSDIEELRRQIVVLPVQNDVLVSSPKTIKGSDEKDTHTTNGDGEEGEGEKCVIDLMEDLENDKVLELKSSPKTIKGSDEKDTQTTNGEEEEGEGEKCVIDLMEDLENDKVLELMIENKVLECEKKKAESDVGFWKAKCEELELRVKFLENNLSSTSGMTNVVVKPVVKTEIVEKECCDASMPLIHTSKGKERLEYGANEEILHEKRKKYDTRTRQQLNFGKETRDNISSVASVPSVKDDHRKKARSIPQKYSSESKSNLGIPTTGSFTDDETSDDDNDSNSEGESLNGFIVSDSESDISVADKPSEGDEIANSNEKSEGNVDYDEIMSMIGRKKKGHLIKWEFEADMLAAFGKDPELCMKAVCALYRQQTSDEQSCKATIHQNQRGFSQCDAPRGSRLGEFLTDGDPEGGLKKSVEELVEFQPKGLDLCTTLATHYSKQLFAMYENKEDPLWPALGTDS